MKPVRDTTVNSKMHSNKLKSLNRITLKEGNVDSYLKYMSYQLQMSKLARGTAPSHAAGHSKRLMQMHMYHYMNSFIHFTVD